MKNKDVKDKSIAGGDKDGTKELFDIVIRLEKMPVAGHHIKINLDSGQLRELAKILTVSLIEDFSATLHVFNEKKGVGVTGNLQATIIQPCVITLEPVTQKIKLQLQRNFVPAPKVQVSKVQVPKKAPEDVSIGAETNFDLESADMPDEYEGHELDLAPFLFEVLGLEIQLYPRAPGAKMDEKQAGDDPKELSPFSVLKNLSEN